jgi:cytochrome c-type biogenesis protein CcmH
MKRQKQRLWFGMWVSLLLGALVPLGSASAFEEFSDPAERERYQALLAELRCTVCQNQSLLDSNAGLAQDLRRQVYSMFSEGATEQQVIDFMVTRYGEFVLYRPPMKPSTYALWFAPLIMLVLGLSTLVIVLRKRSNATPLSEADRKRVEQLLRETTEKNLR